MTYDSCRFDAYHEARTLVLDAYAAPRQAWAQASYTYASHAAMFQGHLPRVFTEEPYYNRYVNSCGVSRTAGQPRPTCFCHRTPA